VRERGTEQAHADATRAAVTPQYTPTSDASGLRAPGARWPDSRAVLVVGVPPVVAVLACFPALGPCADNGQDVV
jgi:hypothetical protein